MKNAWREMYLLDCWYLGDFQAPLYPLIFLQSTPFPRYLQVIAINMTTTGDTGDYINLERVWKSRKYCISNCFVPKDMLL